MSTEECNYKIAYSLGFKIIGCHSIGGYNTVMLNALKMSSMCKILFQQIQHC